MKPAVRYYGGKGRMAPWITSLLPPHRAYIEPFFGAGAVLFAKNPTHSELINDVDGMVVNFYRVLRSNVDELIEQLRLTPYSRDEYNACKGAYEDKTADPVERARRFFVTVSMSFACTTGSASGFSASMKKSVNRARTTSYYVDRLPAIADRLRHVMIENHDAITVIDTHGDARDCLIYCDPPYVHDTRETSSVGGGHGYRHEMTDDDHRALAASLHATPATVILSGYPGALYDELYADWDRVERSAYSTVAGINTHADTTARTEVLWSNRPILDGRLPFDGNAA